MSGSPFSLNTPGCAPEELDVHARYLFGRCGDGVALYTLSVTTAPDSPFAAATGGLPDAMIEENSGQYVLYRRAQRVHVQPSGESACCQRNSGEFRSDHHNLGRRGVGSRKSAAISAASALAGSVRRNIRPALGSGPFHDCSTFELSQPGGCAAGSRWPPSCCSSVCSAAAAGMAARSRLPPLVPSFLQLWRSQPVRQDSCG